MAAPAAGATLARAAQLWSLLDEMAENEPQAYRRLLRQQRAQAQRLGAPPEPHLCLRARPAVGARGSASRPGAGSGYEGDRGGRGGPGPAGRSAAARCLAGRWRGTAVRQRLQLERGPGARGPQRPHSCLRGAAGRRLCRGRYVWKGSRLAPDAFSPAAVRCVAMARRLRLWQRALLALSAGGAARPGCDRGSQQRLSSSPSFLKKKPNLKKHKICTRLNPENTCALGVS